MFGQRSPDGQGALRQPAAGCDRSAADVVLSGAVNDVRGVGAALRAATTRAGERGFAGLMAVIRCAMVATEGGLKKSLSHPSSRRRPGPTPHPSLVRQRMASICAAE